jgi:hypothetical protein
MKAICEPLLTPPRNFLVKTKLTGTKSIETDLPSHGSNRRFGKADRTYQGHLRDDGHRGEVPFPT